jgi:hypothetical protein
MGVLGATLPGIIRVFHASALTMALVALGASNEIATMGARVASLEAALVCGVDQLDSG